MMMVHGKLKTWKQRFGFISRDDGGPDVFVHADEFRRAGHQGDPAVGMRLSFELEDQRDGRQKAVRVELGAREDVYVQPGADEA
jgi:cold shock CspA family protein